MIDANDILKYFKNISLLDYLKDNPVSFSDAHFTSPKTKLQDVAAKFMDSKMPTDPVPLTKYYEKLWRDIIPYTINTRSPTFIGHMSCVVPDYIHDLHKIISEMNLNLVKIETSKSLTFVEREVLAVVHRLFYNFSDDFYDNNIQKVNANLGIITSCGSTANLSALLSARNRALSSLCEDIEERKRKSVWALMQQGGYTDMVLLGSELMHYSFRKSIMAMGLGTNNIVYVRTNAEGQMVPEDLEEKIMHCKQNRLLIVSIVSIAVSTERGSIDPLPEIAEIAKRHGIHLHVDAAWGGALVFSDEYKYLLNGIEKADSITFCAHKQLFLPQGISTCLFKDPFQINYNAVTANYQAKVDSFDMGRFTIGGSKPALVICLHASLKLSGRKGYQMIIDNSINLTYRLAALLRTMDGYELLSHQVNIINYRYIPERFRLYAKTKELTKEMNDEIDGINSAIQTHQFHCGRTFVSKTTTTHPDYGNIVVLRTVISNPLTKEPDLIAVIKDQLIVIEELYDEHNAFDGITSEEKVKSLPAAGVKLVPRSF